MTPEYLIGQLTELPWYLGAGLSVVVGVALARLFSKGRHKWQIRQSYCVLNRVNSFEGNNQNARVLAYLRKIDPYVFEELLLSAFERRGFKIRRNPRYSGDGGVDGEVVIDRKKILLQAKRYKSWIRASDVLDFQSIIKGRRTSGLFVHTGRTGRGSLMGLNERLEILSGQRLTDLILGRPVKIFGSIV